MIRLFVDSGSSIRPEEKEKYGVEILPLKIFIGSKEYSDGDVVEHINALIPKLRIIAVPETLEYLL